MVAEKMDNVVLGGLLKLVSDIVPNLRYFYVTGTGSVDEYTSVHGVFVDWTYVASAGGYALLYVAATLLIAILLFSRRDFV